MLKSRKLAKIDIHGVHISPKWWNMKSNLHSIILITIKHQKREYQELVAGFFRFLKHDCLIFPFKFMVFCEILFGSCQRSKKVVPSYETLYDLIYESSNYLGWQTMVVKETQKFLPDLWAWNCRRRGRRKVPRPESWTSSTLYEGHTPSPKARLR